MTKKIMYTWMMLLSMAIAIPATHAQTHDLEHIYNPAENAGLAIAAAIKQAAKENKHVLLQIGGNWCTWCKRFSKFIDSDANLKAATQNNYIVYHLNYSKENKNLPVLKKLGYPQRFGFPVLVILDTMGNRLHTQNSGLLELDDSYDKKKVQEFLKQWSPPALLPSHYIND